MSIFKVRGKANDETRKPLTGYECCIQVRMRKREIKSKISNDIINLKRT